SYHDAVSCDCRLLSRILLSFISLFFLYCSVDHLHLHSFPTRRSSDLSTTLATLQEEVPEGLIPLLKIQGLGSKKIAKLYKALNIDGKEALQKACEEGKVSELSGFAKKTEQNILEAVKALGAKK